MESLEVLEDKMEIELPVEALKHNDGVPWESGRTDCRIQRRTYTSYM